MDDTISVLVTADAAASSIPLSKSLSRVNRDCRDFVDHHPRWTQPLLQEIFPLDLGLPVILSPLDTPKALVAGYERLIYGCTYPKGHDHVLWNRYKAAWQRLGRTEFKVWWPTHDVKDLKKKYDREQTWINVRFMALGAVISLGMGAALGLSVGFVPGLIAGCVVFAVLLGVSEICHRVHIAPFKAFTAQNMAFAGQSAEETADLQEAIDAL